MLTSIAFRAQVCFSALFFLVYWLGYFEGQFGFFCFLIWMFSIFFQAGLTMGNLTALAMEPVGHIAGTAASLVSSIATIGSVLLAAIVGQFFDGTPAAMIAGVALFATLGAISSHRLKRYDRPSKV
jgi:DHA1 family bicyclomycin/chloramphenicol resistance-like MFS transporter